MERGTRMGEKKYIQDFDGNPKEKNNHEDLGVLENITKVSRS